MSKEQSGAVGIDLGTTNSALAAVEATGRPEIVRNAQGHNTTPSVVLFRGGSVLVGTPAKQQRASFSLDVVENVKRHMADTDWCHVTEDGEEYTSEQVAALILRKLREDAARALGREIGRAVITVPAYFDDPRRQATRDAGTIAGLEVLAIISEPTAAALAYGLKDAEAGTVLVYDLGGGTFDVTVIRIGDGVFDVIATAGDRELGGVNFDGRLMDWVNEQVIAASAQDIYDGDTRDIALLRDQCETAKHTLSSMEEAEVFVDSAGRSLDLTVTRSVFEDITDDLLERTTDLVEEVMETARASAGLTMADLDHVLLVGGSTRMPMVRQALAKLTGKQPEESLHPDEAVALGAAVQAELIEARSEERAPAVGEHTVSDVTAHGLGVISQEGVGGRLVNSVIVPEQSKIPASRSEVFHTLEDNQTVVNVEITIGDSPDPNSVGRLTEQDGVDLSIPPYPKGSPVRVTMSYDVDAIVQVDVHDMVADKPLGRVQIDRANNLAPKQIQQMASRLSRERVR
ncbi:molecular chaperone DnaK [Lipingzhangella halophila]|uniref:Molecular chaperone DnaK n=1 Tax=Lipingzhangella halophila TaxID=1783352 RepID=A0A7W7RNC1_9ACTN|nr:Hsp70 family protein [Lipingzhangella halophila]MBB4935154.1 molecular chaperone DnaK [Lipingzhangella halophila]